MNKKIIAFIAVLFFAAQIFVPALNIGQDFDLQAKAASGCTYNSIGNGTKGRTSHNSNGYLNLSTGESDIFKVDTSDAAAVTAAYKKILLNELWTDRALYDSEFSVFDLNNDGIPEVAVEADTVEWSDDGDDGTGYFAGAILYASNGEIQMYKSGLHLESVSTSTGILIMSATRGKAVSYAVQYDSKSGFCELDMWWYMPDADEEDKEMYSCIVDDDGFEKIKQKYYDGMQDAVFYDVTEENLDRYLVSNIHLDNASDNNAGDNTEVYEGMPGITAVPVTGESGRTVFGYAVMILLIIIVAVLFLIAAVVVVVVLLVRRGRRKRLDADKNTPKE